jgi:hypothetical protein
VQLEAGIARAKYFIRGERHEVIAWTKLRDLDGRRRVEIGSFRSVGEARAACEREAQLRCRRDSEERPAAVDVRISPSRRGRAPRSPHPIELAGWSGIRVRRWMLP